MEEGETKPTLMDEVYRILKASATMETKATIASKLAKENASYKGMQRSILIKMVNMALYGLKKEMMAVIVTGDINPPRWTVRVPSPLDTQSQTTPASKPLTSPESLSTPSPETPRAQTT